MLGRIGSLFSGKQTDAVITSYIESTGYGIEAEIPMAELVRRRKTDYLFNMVCHINTAYSTGAGFYNTANTDEMVGRKCLESIDEFCDEWELDDLHQKIALDVWTSGNAFLDAVEMEGGRLGGLRILPLSSFTRIYRDEDGIAQRYEQSWGGRYSHVDAKDIMHFRWMEEDASAWGTGTGQILARRGLGYKTNSGQTVHRPSLFETREMMDDIAIKITYSGMPRFSVKAPDAKADDLRQLTSLYSKLDPLQHIVHNYDTDIQNLSLDTNGKYESFFKRTDNASIAAMMNPIIQLWTSMSFTYASAMEAIDAMMPLVRIYQRAHKRFIERNVYRRIIMDEKGRQAVKRADVQLNWGSEDPMDMEAIRQVYEILRDPKFDGLYDPKDVIEMLRDAGAKVNPTAQADMSRQFRDLERLKNMRERKVHISELPREEQIREIKLRLLKRMGGRA